MTSYFHGILTECMIEESLPAFARGEHCPVIDPLYTTKDVMAATGLERADAALLMNRIILADQYRLRAMGVETGFATAFHWFTEW